MLNAYCLIHAGDDLFYDHSPQVSHSPRSLSTVPAEPSMRQEDLSQIMDFLQEQQAILCRVLEQQESMKDRQNELEGAMNALTEEVQLVREADTHTEKQQKCRLHVPKLA